MPDVYAPMLEGFAVAIGPTSADSDQPLAGLADAQAIIAGSRVRYDGALMDQAPGLRVIARSGIGIDNLSLPDATARGVAVCNAPDGPTISTAEHAIALLMAATKFLKRNENSLRDGRKHDFFGENQGLELAGQQLGLVGMGRIGSRVARVARAMDMNVVVYDPYISAERAAELGVTLVPTLEALLSTSDVVSLHLPATPETRHLINARSLARMKPGAFLINTARGALIDESALIQALDSGRLAGVGLDVFDPEPPDFENPLLHRDNVIATPHVASATGAGKDRLWRTAIAQAIQVLRGERPPHLLNPEVWDKLRSTQG
jgi:D-3-phosphoglycerate dehydrogenase